MTIAVGIVGFAVGMLLGIIIAARHVELECEEAYLYGHVDGYRKAEDDAGEVPL